MVGDFENTDHTGGVVEFLHDNSEIYGKMFDEAWFDVGSYSEIEKVKNYLEKKDCEKIEDDK